MPSNKPPLPNPLDKLRATIERGSVGGGAASDAPGEIETPRLNLPTRAPGEAEQGNRLTGQQGALSTGQQGNRVPGQQDNRATGQQGDLLPGQQGNKPTSQQGARAPGQIRTSRAGWEVQTMYLPGDLRKWLKIESVMQEKEIGEIVAEILREHLARLG